MHVRAYIRAALVGALALCFAVPATAQVAQFRAIVVPSCGSVTLPLNEPATPYMDRNGILCTTAGAGGGGGGATGSVTAPGTSGTSAQAIQGITGGVPVPVTGSFSAAAAPGSQEQDVRASTTLSAATANAAVTIALNGQGTVGFTFTGLTASGATLTYEQSNDGGTTWTGINEVNAGTGVPAGTRTIDGQTRVSVSGRTNLRVRVSTAGSGTITVAYNVSVREGLMTLASPLPPGSNVVGAVTQSGAWTFGLSGPIPAGTNTIGTVNLGTLNGAALDTTLQGVATSNSAINAATGTQADAATVSGSNTTLVGGIRAIRDRLLGILNVTLAAGSNTIGAVTQAGTWAVNSTLQAGSAIIGKVGIDQTTPGVTNGVVQTPGTAISVLRTANIGTTGVQVSGTDATNRRTVTNTSTLACELMGSAAAYGTGYPLPAGGSFTFDSSGRTTAALFVACSAAGGTVAVLNF